MPDYGNPSYWDERYSARSNESFDWYQSYSRIKPFIKTLLSTNGDFEVLIPGSGNSPLGAELFREGYQNITCVDASTVVVQQMQERYRNIESLEFIPANCCCLDFVPENCFDFILDKALLDALLCGDNSFSKATEYIWEMYRILKPGGSFAIVSHGSPSTRINLLENADRNWKVEQAELPKPPLTGYENEESTSHYIYVCTKN